MWNLFLLVLNNMNIFAMSFITTQCKHKPLNLVGTEIEQRFGNVKFLTEKEYKIFLSLLFCGVFFLFLVCLWIVLRFSCPKKCDLCYSVWRLSGNMGV